MDKLNLINTFLQVAARGSFAAASAQMGVDPSTISKAISQLESHLSVRLFIRSTRKLQLSEAGQTYQQHCMRLMEELDYCEQELALNQIQPKGLLKINLPVSYGQLYVMPLVSKFRNQYPEIRLDISLTDDYVDMVGNSIDIAIRSGQLQDSRLVARKLTPMDFATCASPAYLASHPPVTPANIEQQRWVNYRFIHTGRTMPLYRLKGRGKQKQSQLIEPDIVLTTTDGLSMVRAGIEGVGLIQAPHFLLRDAVLKRQLVIVQSYLRYEQFNVFAYYSHKDFLPAKVNAFLDFITHELARIGENKESTFLSGLST